MGISCLQLLHSVIIYLFIYPQRLIQKKKKKKKLQKKSFKSWTKTPYSKKCTFHIYIDLGRAKRIWYLSPMRAAKVQASQNLRCSLIQAVRKEEPSDGKPDPWPLWMAGHAQLKFVMTECSKTQIRLTRPIYFVHIQPGNLFCFTSFWCLHWTAFEPRREFVSSIPSILTAHAFRGALAFRLKPWLTACMSEQRRFWRDCADAQARLNLRCSHRWLVPNSLDAVHLILILEVSHLSRFWD